MKLYTVYSDSHAAMLKRFLIPSCNWAEEVVAVHIPQDCPSGIFHSIGWDAAMRRKCQVIIDAIKDKQPFIFADADVIFFDDPVSQVAKVLKNADIACQRDNSEGIYCAGLFACNPTKEIRLFWENIMNDITPDFDDQQSLNARLHSVKYDYLPASFANIAAFNSSKFWSGQGDAISQLQNCKFTDRVVAFHANCVKGVLNKERLLEAAKVYFN